MRVKIKETGKIEEFSIIDPYNGIEWTDSLIDGTSAFNSGHFVWNGDTDCFIVTQEIYDWWVDYINRYNAVTNRAYMMDLTDGEREELLEAAGYCDTEYIPSFRQKALDIIEDKRKGVLR